MMYSKILKHAASGVSIILLAATIFSGCSNSSKSTDNEQTKGNHSNAQEEKYDLKGKKVIIAVPNESYIPKEDSNDTVLNIVLKRKQEVETKYNCVIEWKASNAANAAAYKQEIIEAVQASQYYADAAIVSTSAAFPELVSKKIIFPLDEYVDYNGELFNNSLQHNLMWEGKHYGVTYYKQSPMIVSYITYNKDIFSSVGLPDPYDLMAKGQWTWQALLDSAVKTTIDKNGDGTKDQWGLEGTYKTLLRSFIISNGGSYVKEQDGKYAFSLTDDKALKAVKFANELYNNHKIVADPAISSSLNDLYVNNRAAMYYTIPLRGKEAINSGLVMFPKGPDESDYISLGYGVNFYAVLSNCSNPKAISKIISELICLWDTSKKDHIAPDDLFKNTPTAVSPSAAWTAEGNNLETLKYAYDKVKFHPFESNSSIIEMYNKAFTNIIKDKMSVEGELDNIKSEAQQLIDNIANVNK